MLDFIVFMAMLAAPFTVAAAIYAALYPEEF